MKKLIALLLAAAMLLCFAGCGTKDTNSGSDASELKVGLYSFMTSSQPTTKTLWTPQRPPVKK